MSAYSISCYRRYIPLLLSGFGMERFANYLLSALLLANQIVLPAFSASVYDQKKAAMETAYAIENTRKQYELESAAAAQHAERINRLHEESRRAAEASSRLRPLLADSYSRQIASLASVQWSVPRVGERPGQTDMPRNPRSNSFVDPDQPALALQNLPTVLQGGITEIRIEPRPPRPSIVSLMQATENKLMDLHERGRIGSFDIDRFSERLLAIKKNFSVMIASRNILSPRQEYILRNQMRVLEKEICERAD